MLVHELNSELVRPSARVEGPFPIACALSHPGRMMRFKCTGLGPHRVTISNSSDKSLIHRPRPGRSSHFR